MISRLVGTSDNSDRCASPPNRRDAKPQHRVSQSARRSALAAFVLILRLSVARNLEVTRMVMVTVTVTMQAAGAQPANLDSG